MQRASWTLMLSHYRPRTRGQRLGPSTEHHLASEALKAMEKSKREAYGKVVRLVLAFSAPLLPPSAFYLIESKEVLVGAVGIESTSYMETKEFCGAPWPCK
jgi:hypothetical protein